MAKRLISAQAYVGLQDRKGRTPLHWAISSDNLLVIQRLINAGADIDKQNLKGQTPLDVALEDDLQEVARFLIDQGASISIEYDVQDGDVEMTYAEDV
jgi:ankyrin repeat protein